ncbi:hypothetical protein AB0E83_03450 [Streptomyces sp. NPDC035033]|uniref:hypothetical protein n=1 Tax=Streptomyces sp. NPDC035033 TaxID=3155368 RepID=UPI0033EC3288
MAVPISESALVRGALEARRPTRWWVGWLVVFLGGVIAINIAVEPAARALLGDPATGSPKAQWVELFTNAATLAVVAAWVCLKERRPFLSLGFRGTHRLASLAAASPSAPECSRWVSWSLPSPASTTPMAPPTRPAAPPRSGPSFRS